MYFRARYYDPATGEFISQDLLEYVDGMSQYRAYFVPGATDPSGAEVLVPAIGSGYYHLNPDGSVRVAPDGINIDEKGCDYKILPNLKRVYTGECFTPPVIIPREKCPGKKEGPKYIKEFGGNLDDCVSSEWRLLRDGACGVVGGVIGTAVTGGNPWGTGIGGLAGTALIPTIICTAACYD